MIQTEPMFKADTTQEILLASNLFYFIILNKIGKKVLLVNWNGKRLFFYKSAGGSPPD
jgi:hypothetical protein